jgi:hypothetical protein
LSALVVAPPRAQQLPSGAHPIAEAPAEWQAAVSQADLIVASLHDSLLRELSSMLSQKDPADALPSCHIDLIGTIQRLGRRERVTAGRTSDRLRNQANAAPAWAAPVVAAYGGRRASDVEGFAVDLNDRVGVLRPIAEQPVCASCHGPDRTRPEGVDAALAARYPRDRATGFENGEIRGWYWVVLDKPPRQ